MDRHIFVCATNGKVETNVIHLQWHYRRSEIIIKDDALQDPLQDNHMERFDMTFTPGEIARLQNDYQRQIGRVRPSLPNSQPARRSVSRSQVSEHCNILNRPLTVGPQELDQASNKGVG